MLISIQNSSQSRIHQIQYLPLIDSKREYNLARYYEDRGSYALSITPEHIERISSIAEEVLSQNAWTDESREEPKHRYQWVALFNDNTLDSNLSKEDVLNLPNGKKRRIIGLRVKSLSKFKGCSISFGVIGAPTVKWEASAEGDANQVTLFQTKLSALMPDLKPWWGRLSKVSLMLYPLLGLALYIIIRGIHQNIFGPPQNQELPLTAEEIETLKISGFLILLGAAGIADIWRSFVFPTFIISIGEGKTQADQILGIRSKLIAAAFAAFPIIWALAST